jgi:hypothetical protein
MNIITVVIVVSVNIMTSFSYIFADEPVYLQDVVEVSGDAQDSISDDSFNVT